MELEMLAIAWACKKCANFIEGTDHKPLIPMLHNYSLNDFENKRLQKLKMKIDHLNFEVEWVPGKKNEEADALSRAPIHQATEEDEIDKIEINLESINAINTDFEEGFDEFDEEVSDLLIKEVQKEAEKGSGLPIAEKCSFGRRLIQMFTVKLDSCLKYLDMLSIDDNGLIIKDGTK